MPPVPSHWPAVLRTLLMILLSISLCAQGAMAAGRIGMENAGPAKAQDANPMPCHATQASPVDSGTATDPIGLPDCCGKGGCTCASLVTALPSVPVLAGSQGLVSPRLSLLLDVSVATTVLAVPQRPPIG